MDNLLYEGNNEGSAVAILPVAILSRISRQVLVELQFVIVSLW